MYLDENVVRNKYKYYEVFTIKTGNKQRQIEASKKELKEMQRWILENVLSKFVCSKYAKAYVKDRTILDSVKYHKKAKVIIKMDVEHFFNNISEKKIVQVFLRNNIPLNKAVYYADICCYEERLPQGAPTSPCLSNLFMLPFDCSIGDFCRENKLFYTRYADDITISSFNNLNVEDILKIKNEVKKHLNKIGLSVNNKKTKVLRKEQSQRVMGIVLNSKMQVNRTYRMKLRQEIKFINKFGLQNCLNFMNRKNNTNLNKLQYKRQLLGRIGYILFINPNDSSAIKYREIIKKADWDF